jgi:predicted transcriptional regulator
MAKGLELEIAPDGHQNQLEPNSSVARAFLLLKQMQSRYLPVKIGEEWVGVISMLEIQKLMENCRLGRSMNSSDAKPKTVRHYMKSPIKILEANESSAETLKIMAWEASENDFEAFVILKPEQPPTVVTKQDLLAFLATLLEEGPKNAKLYSERLESAITRRRERADLLGENDEKGLKTT